MGNFISGAIAMAMGLVFFLYYAIRIKSITLWIIIVAGVIMMVYDFYESVRGNDKPPSM